MTMGDIARCSLGRANEFYNEDLLYRMFGVNAELLIDHAWGWEPCCISDIKRYKPSENSISSGQVLHCACAYERARLIVREMADAMALDLVDRGLLAGRLGLYVGYDRKTGSEDAVEEKGTDHYGRTVPKAANAVVSLPKPTASSRVVIAEIERLYDRIVDPRLMVRRITVEAGSVRPEGGIDEAECGVDEEHASMSAELGRSYRQLDLFANMDEVDDSGCMNAIGEADGCPALPKTDGHERREIDAQKAMLAVRNKFGRNAVLRGMNFETGATGRMRNEQIGGHAAGESRVGFTVNGDERSGGAVVVSRDGNGLGMRPVWIDGERQVFMPEHQWPLDRKDSAKPEAIHSGIPVGPRQGSDAAPAMRRTDRYNDILGVPHHRSDRHPPMGRSNRAAQFMPFAALTGYEAKLEAMIERINKEYQESDGYESPEIRERIASERRERIEQLARRLQAVGDRPHSVAAQRDRRRLGEVLEERYREYLEEFGTGEDYAGENHEGEDCMGENNMGEDKKTAGVKTARVKNAEEKTAGDGREDGAGEGRDAPC